LSEVDVEQSPRISTGLQELDRVLGGGLVPGSVILLGGEPGIGKSTLALQAVSQISSNMSTLYISAEESLEQLALRYRRLSLPDDGLQAITTGELEVALSLIGNSDARLVVVDSIQTMHTDRVDSAPGGVGQVRACAEILAEVAKRDQVAILIIGHVTKEGGLAGPKTLEHLVDTVLYFEGDATSRYRMIRAWKNRFGAVNEVGIFAMTEAGLKEVRNPSAMFLSGSSDESAGRSVLVSQDGSRPILVEIQALIDQSSLGSPRRLSVGYEGARLAMILAVLHRHAKLNALDQDVFINVAGGVRIAETAADLAVAAALLSSESDRPIPVGTAFFGELGLTGEVRPVARGEDRIREAIKLGYKRLILPAANIPKAQEERDKRAISIELTAVRHVMDLRDLLRGGA
jgi:DNA repair protein RadA/Sms